MGALDSGRALDIGESGAWELVIDEDGSSFANWSGIAGTWSSSGGNIQNTDNAAAVKAAYLTTPKVPLAHCVIDFEIQFPTSGQGTAPNYAGIYPGMPNSIVTDQTTIRLQRDATPANSLILITPNDTAAAKTLSVTIALDTWYAVRVVISGGAVSFYLDGTLVGSIATSRVPPAASNSDITYLGLTTYSAAAFWRNIKVWTPTQPA